MEKEDIIELIGANTTFKFYCCSDGIFYFQSLVPNLDFEMGLYFYELSVYVDDKSNNIFHDFNYLDDLIRENQVCELKKIFKNEEGETIVFNKYNKQ